MAPTARIVPSRLHQNVLPPGLPAAAISRPRLDALYAGLLDEHEALAVFAAAGSGKTVQAQMFATREEWPLAWLTLDAADRSSSRMLAYLASALRPHVSHIDRVIDEAFVDTPVLEEVAALLAEAIDMPRLLIVLDQCEAIAESAQSCSVLEAFLDYLPGGVRMMLLSRQEMQFSLGRLLLHGRVGRITDEDLALTVEEATSLIEARGEDTGDVAARLEAARGWIAAVAFGGPHRPGGHDHARDFSSYLASEIFDVLPGEERQFLLDTSILDAVSLRAATALCGPESRLVWRDVGMRHLPATTSADRTIVYHPCFRGFLRDQLELLDPERLARLQRAHASLLIEGSQFEEAVELFLSLGGLDDAAEMAEKASRRVLDRGDWDTVLRWTDALGRDRVHASAELLGALLRALRGVRRLEEARALARELDRTGRLADVVAVDPGVIAHVAWSMLWQPRESLALLDRYDGGLWAAGVRYMLQVTSGEHPVAPPQGLPWRETDRLVSWALMVQGRLDELVGMAPSDDQWPPRTPYTTPHGLLGLVWRGELERARALFDQVSEEMKHRIHTDLWNYLESWLLLAEGDAPAALAAAERAVVHSRRTGFGFEAVFLIVQGHALLHLGRVDAAMEVLHESIESNRAGGLRAYVEWGLAFLGHAHLMRGEDERAAELLREAVTGMTRADRTFCLPMAAVYLAEAERRLGDGAAADDAAALAYEASLRMGAFPAMQASLERFPGVLHRQLERHPDRVEWRRLGVRPSAGAGPRPAARSGAAVVDVQPFGAGPDIIVDGRPAGVRRLKVLELACYLAAHPAGVSRDEVQGHLFPESDRRRGSNHFRQVVHQLRKTTGLTLQRLSGSDIAWSEGLRVDAADMQFERGLAAARALVGRERLDRLRAALQLPVGAYLAASDLEWVSGRRFELEVLQEGAELEAAQLAFELADFEAARGFCEAVLGRNEFCETAYRVLIEVELAVGTETRALASYRRAVAALREIGLQPDRATAGLLHQFHA